MIALLLAACGLLAHPEPTPPDDLRCDRHPTEGCFVRVEGGTFLRGAQASDPAAPGYDPAARPDEGPVRSITLSPYWIQQTEVPRTSWVLCLEKHACPEPGIPFDQLRGPDELAFRATGLTWEDARALCASLGARLPTEAEWEFAVRGPEGRRYPWGADPPCGLGSSVDRFAGLTPDQWPALPGCESTDPPVSPRTLGLHDLRDPAWGNWEWVADRYAADAYATGPDRDPTGPEAGERRVQRGGSWSSTDPTELRAAARSSLLPTTRTVDGGVRCAW